MSNQIDPLISFMAKFARNSYSFDKNDKDFDSLLPSHYHIDRELTIDNDNVLMVSDIDKIAVWSIRGTVFTLAQTLDDIRILVNGEYTNIFSDDYYKNKLSAIIKKYKQHHTTKYDIYVSSHSLGANKQLYTIFGKNRNNSFFVDNISGIFSFAMGASPLSIGGEKISIQNLNYCNDRPFICEKAHGKTFNIYTDYDAIANFIKYSSVKGDLGKISQFYNVPVPEALLDAYVDEYKRLNETKISLNLNNNLGLSLLNRININAKFLYQFHNLNFYINEFRENIQKHRRTDVLKREKTINPNINIGQSIKSLKEIQQPKTEKHIIYDSLQGLRYNPLNLFFSPSPMDNILLSRFKL